MRPPPETIREWIGTGERNVVDQSSPGVMLGYARMPTGTVVQVDLDL